MIGHFLRMCGWVMLQMLKYLTYQTYSEKLTTDNSLIQPETFAKGYNYKFIFSSILVYDQRTLTLTDFEPMDLTPLNFCPSFPPSGVCPT